MTTDRSASLGRRAFLGALGAGASAAATGALAAPAQAAGEKREAKTTAPLKIIDFHNHYVGPNFALTTLAGAPPALRSYWEGVNRNLADPHALLSSIENSGIAGATVDLLGADHVLVGTDWPIAVEKSMPERVQAALAGCGLDAAEQQMVASGNTLKLLGVS